MEAVCPAFVVMHYDVLADPGPFLIIFRRIDVVFCLRVGFDGLPEPVHHLCAGIQQRLDKGIGFAEIIGGFLVGILAEIRKNVGNVHQVMAVIIIYG